MTAFDMISGGRTMRVVSVVPLGDAKGRAWEAKETPTHDRPDSVNKNNHVPLLLCMMHRCNRAVRSLAIGGSYITGRDDRRTKPEI